LTNSPQLLSNIQSQQSVIASNQRLIAQDAATIVQNFTEQRFRALTVAVQLTNLETESSRSRTEILQRLLGLEPSFLRLISLDAEGQMLTQASRLSLAASRDVDAAMVTDLLRQTQQGRQYISPVVIDPITSEPEVLMAVPVTDVFGDIHGALVAVMNLKFMWDMVHQLDVGEGGLAYVVDRQGNLLAFNDTARVLRGENVAHIQVVGEFMARSTVHEAAQMSRYTGILGTDVVGSYVALGMPDWAVVTEMPWAVAYRSVIHDIGLVIGILLGIAILAGFIGIYVAWRLTAPLVKLMDTASRIADGERDLQVAISGPREVTALAQAFNTMTAQLRTSLEGLEQRTADLQSALVDVEARSNEQARLLEENRQQRQAIRELSVPVLPVTDDTLVMPLIGAIDTERLANIQGRALQELERASARYLLLDITGVPVVDSQVAQGLLSVAQMTRLLGAEVILIGVRPEVAQTIVDLGLDLKSLRTAADLQMVLNNVVK
jgi:anti-anti-sigma regulatory factor/HAMP domain-containing protein